MMIFIILLFLILVKYLHFRKNINNLKKLSLVVHWSSNFFKQMRRVVYMCIMMMFLHDLQDLVVDWLKLFLFNPLISKFH
jgi:hypothetical protein